MARVIAFANFGVQVPMRKLQFELLRAGLVCSCALALVLAGQPLPY